ncbi:MAG: hypothetical protein ACJAZO_000751 [Myxococcota bacterium]
MRWLAPIVWGLAACSGTPNIAVEPVLDGTEAPAIQVVSVPAARPDSNGVAELVIQYEGVSPLYRGFFNDAAAGDALARAAQACVGDTTYLYVSYDTETRTGRLTLRVEPNVATCRPVQVDGGWQTSPSFPLSRALAHYRDALASAYDLRIAAFHVQVAVRTTRSMCTLRAEGTHPPDGDGFGACVLHGLEERCGVVGDDGLLAFEAADIRALRTCFGP